MRSKSDENTTSNCAPERNSPNGAIVPCGLIAWSLFNDTYKFSVKNKQLGVNKKDITWKSDKGNKFGSDVYPKNFQSGGLIGGAKLNSSIPVNLRTYLSCSVSTVYFVYCFKLILFSGSACKS